MLAFAVLLVAAFGAGCGGFFVDPTLTSIAISPTSPQVEVGKTVTLEAFGTYDDGSRKQVKSGVSWSSGTPTIAMVDTNTGIMTGVAQGTSTITASAQALSGTATATVILSNITSLTVNPTTWSVGQAGGNQEFTATANGSIDVTTSATWTVTPTPASGSITCTNGGSPPETCTVAAGTSVQTYRITVTYPGTSLAPFVTLAVTP